MVCQIDAMQHRFVQCTKTQPWSAYSAYLIEADLRCALKLSCRGDELVTIELCSSAVREPVVLARQNTDLSVFVTRILEDPLHDGEHQRGRPAEQKQTVRRFERRKEAP